MRMDQVETLLRDHLIAESNRINPPMGLERDVITAIEGASSSGSRRHGLLPQLAWTAAMLAIVVGIAGGAAWLRLQKARPNVLRPPVAATITPTPSASTSAAATPIPSPSVLATGQLVAATTFNTADGAWTRFQLPNSALQRLGVVRGPDGAVWFAAMGVIGRIDSTGREAEYPLPDPNASAQYITTGPDGALWFTESGGQRGKIGRITPDGYLTEYPVPTSPSGPEGIIAGPDGALWFADETGNFIGRITTSGQIRQFPLPTRGGPVQCGNLCPVGIAAGSDGALWFTETQFAQAGGQRIGRMTSGGSLTEYQGPTAPPFQIVPGADGALWFSEAAQGKIGRITLSGKITEYTLHTANLGAVAQGMATGPFGNVWFTVGKANGQATASGNQLGRIAPDGTIVGYVVPGSGMVGWIGAGSETEVWFTYSDGQIWRFMPKM